MIAPWKALTTMLLLSPPVSLPLVPLKGLCVAFNPVLGHRMMLFQVVIDFFGLRLHDA